jgi:hypothetical protein
MAFIRRAQLDAFWARATRTVANNLQLVRDGLRVGEDFGFDMYEPLGPWRPTYDHGMRVAIHCLARSIRPGRHEVTMKYSAVRKVRGTANNLYVASATANQDNLILDQGNRGTAVLTKSPARTEWVYRFMTGMENRLGQRTKQDVAISIEVMLELMRRFEDDVSAHTLGTEAYRSTVMAATFCILSYTATLRGYEVPMVVLTYLAEFCVDEEVAAVRMVSAHCGIPLAGKLKLRGGMDQAFLTFVAKKTASGLEPMVWVKRLIALRAAEGWDTGWAFADRMGYRMKMRDFAEEVFRQLGEIQRTTELIPKELDVYEAYGLARSFRRGATTQATNKGVKDSDINWANRWKAGTQSQTKTSGDMRERYADEQLMLESFLRFSSAL